MTSCGVDDGVDGPVAIRLWDIVTYEGSDSQGSVFTFRQVDDSPLITLTAPVKFESLEPGTRLAISYIPESGKAYTSGPVKLVSASKITQSKLETEWNDDYALWDKDPVYVYSMWRSGSYINLDSKLTYTSEPRIFRLVVDPATSDSESPKLYLVHILPDDTDNHDRAYIASFDISDLWVRPNVREVRVHVANSNLNKDIFTFKKSE